jgi:hypothetical protein
MPDIARAVRFVIDDEPFREQIMRAGRAGRAAVTRPAPRPTRLRRAGVAVGALGEAITRAGARAEARRRAHRRSLALRGVVLGGAGTATAIALARRGHSSAPAPRKETSGV